MYTSSSSGSLTAKLCLVEIHLQLLWLHPFLSYSLLPPSLTPSIPISLPFFHSHCCTLHITIHMHGGGCMNSLCEYVLFLQSLPGQCNSSVCGQSEWSSQCSTEPIGSRCWCECSRSNVSDVMFNYFMMCGHNAVVLNFAKGMKEGEIKHLTNPIIVHVNIRTQMTHHLHWFIKRRLWNRASQKALIWSSSLMLL